MQSAPGLQLTRPYWGSVVVHWSLGAGQVVGSSQTNFGPMPTRPSRLGLGGGVGVEAAAGAQAHQEADRLVGQGQAEVDRVIARVEGEDRERRPREPAPARSGSARPPPG